MRRMILGLSLLAVVGFVVGLGIALTAGEFAPPVYRSAPPSAPQTVYCPPGSSPPPAGFVCGGNPPPAASGLTPVQQPIVVAAVLIALAAGVLMLIAAASNDQGRWVAAIIGAGILGVVGSLAVGLGEALRDGTFPTVVEFAPVLLIPIVTLAYSRFGSLSRTRDSVRVAT